MFNIKYYNDAAGFWAKTTYKYLIYFSIYLKALFILPFLGLKTTFVE